MDHLFFANHDVATANHGSRFGRVRVTSLAINNERVVDCLLPDLEPGPALLTDNSPEFLSRAIEKSLKVRATKHILAAPFHPQTNGKIERYHRSLKGEISLQPYDMPGDPRDAISTFVEYYNHRRYHEGLGNVTPWDVYTGRHLGIVARRKEVKSRTLQARSGHNDIARKTGQSP